MERFADSLKSVSMGDSLFKVQCRDMGSSDPDLGCLPPELWLKISHWLSLSSLSLLSRTNKYFLQLARPLLYRRLILGQNRLNHSPSITETISLLRKNEGLSSCIQSLRLYRNYPHILDALDKMSNLDHLSVDEWAFFTSANEQDAFVSVLNYRSKLVRKLEVGRTRFASEDFEVNGLERLAWRMTPCTS